MLDSLLKERTLTLEALCRRLRARKEATGAPIISTRQGFHQVKRGLNKFSQPSKVAIAELLSAIPVKTGELIEVKPEEVIMST